MCWLFYLQIQSYFSLQLSILSHWGRLAAYLHANYAFVLILPSIVVSPIELCVSTQTKKSSLQSVLVISNCWVLYVIVHSDRQHDDINQIFSLNFVQDRGPRGKDNNWRSIMSIEGISIQEDSSFYPCLQAKSWGDITEFVLIILLAFS